MYVLFQGTDLTKSTTDALAESVSEDKPKGSTNVLTSLVTAIPNQGVLKPYERVPVFFRFSPRFVCLDFMVVNHRLFQKEIDLW